jgi:L-asparaginase/Glu-tRNA(Gln) amidotransferase subunit D
MIAKKDRSIPTWLKQSNFRKFRERYLQQDQRTFPALFVGSGVSISAGLPNWLDLLIQLATRHDALYAAAPVLPSVMSHLDAKNSQMEYYEAGSILEKAFLRADESGDSWYRELARILDPEELKDHDSKIHGLIAGLRWRRIITTNYDRLLDRAVERVEPRRHAQVTFPGAQEFKNAMQHEDSDYILKIHGNLGDRQSRLILSRESYDELYAQTNMDYRKPMSTHLNSSSVILFVGYSHDDEYVSKLFDDEMYRDLREKVFAIVPREGRGTDFDDRLRKLTTRLEIKFITYSPDDHHHELLEFLDYLTGDHAAEYDQRYGALSTIRTPTVVMLHCGGTIGSSPEEVGEKQEEQLEVVRKTSRFDQELSRFSGQLLDWYQSSYNVGETFQPEILWEILPYEYQMLSENATPELWNALREKVVDIIYKYFQAPVLHEAGSYSEEPKLGKLYDSEYEQYLLAQPEGTDRVELTEKRFRHDFTNRYIMGVVILFGTDTLAFAASALGLSIQHLPCPVVITGANQPPHEVTPGLYHASSDAWSNLMSSLYFLQCFGHRLTEVFVCFGGTIHNSVNLRKRTAEIIPTMQPTAAKQYSEPFAFRNVSLRGQYMFRLIDHVFCNNYYPNPVSYREMLEQRDFKDLRHIRFDALYDTPAKNALGQNFSTRVAYVEVTPCFPPIHVDALVRNGITAILVQGYPSGTYPSIVASAFRQFLIDTHAAGIPLVLISRYGTLASQQEYHVDVEHSHVLPLYEIICETALPLLSLIMRPPEEDDTPLPPQTSEELIRSRFQLVRDGIRAIFHERPNILSQELREVAQKEKMYDALVDLQAGKIEKRRQHWKRQLPRWEKFPSMERMKSVRDMREEGFVLSAREDLLALLNEFPRAFEKVESGPDGFKALFDAGFDAGLPMWESFRKPRGLLKRARRHAASDHVDEHDGETLFRHDPPHQEKRRAEAESIVSRICEALDSGGFTETVDVKLQIHPPVLSSRPDQLVRPGSFSLALHLRRNQNGIHDERYAVMAFSPEEREFFLALQNGCALDDDPEKFKKHLAALYGRILSDTWVHLTRTVDWLLLGLFKGVACGAALLLRLDRNPMDVLRARMKSRISDSDETDLKITYEYFEKN